MDDQAPETLAKATETAPATRRPLRRVPLETAAAPSTGPAPAPAATPVPPAEGEGEGLTGPRHFPAVSQDAVREVFESGRYPYARPMGRAPYEAEKARLQAELLKVQIWAQETGQKFVILMEGRDAAGKGGTIKRFMEHLNPRYARSAR